MSEPQENQPTRAQPTGWVKVFHKSGLLVSLPVDCNADDMIDYQVAYAAVDMILAAGFTVSAPGLEAGEQREQIGYAIRSEKQNKDGSVTNVIGLYNMADAFKFAFMKVYLNTTEDVESFEYASGLQVDQMLLYDGDGMPQRGHKKIIKTPKPFGLVWKDNPEYDEDKAAEAKQANTVYKVPKKVFVRWEAADGKPKAGSAEDATRQAVVEDWKQFFATDPTILEFNAKLPEFGKLPKGSPERDRLWVLVQEHALAAGWVWDADAKVFLPVPANKEEEIPF